MKTENHFVKLDTVVLTGESGEDQHVEVGCTFWGDLNRPMVVLLGGISASRWALDGSNLNHTGWWNQVINESSYLNTENHCFLTFDYFVYPETVIDPPTVTTCNQAEILRQIQTRLNLAKFHAVIGSSYGGMVALAFAAQFPTATEHLICIAAADMNSVKSQALRGIQRKIIELGCQQQGNAQFRHPARSGGVVCGEEYTALARSLAMIGYRGEAELEQRFQSEEVGKASQQVNKYLEYHGNKFAENFSPSRYLQLSKSIDYHHVDVSTIAVKTQLVGIISDQMVPVKLIQQLGKKLAAEVAVDLINSNYGHDGFLLEGQKLNQIFQTFLSENIHDHSERNHRCASGY